MEQEARNQEKHSQAVNMAKSVLGSDSMPKAGRVNEGAYDFQLPLQVSCT
jgi:hypothetical protein